MDLSTLPDIVQHFIVAAQFVPEYLHTVSHEAENIGLAFSADSDMGAVEKIYHAGKSVVLCGLFVASAITSNVEGLIGTGLAEADEYYYLRKEGEQARVKRCAGHDDAPQLPPPG